MWYIWDFPCGEKGEGRDVVHLGFSSKRSGARLCPPLGAGNSGKGFLRRRPFFAEFRAGVRQNTWKKHKDPRPLELLFGAVRQSEIRISSVNGFICSERIRFHYLITCGGFLARANRNFE